MSNRYLDHSYVAIAEVNNLADQISRRLNAVRGQFQLWPFNRSHSQSVSLCGDASIIILLMMAWRVRTDLSIAEIYSEDIDILGPSFLGVPVKPLEALGSATSGLLLVG
ncbi:MAG: hypothetical protein KDD53_12635, partial [Bdellovibrionales bacterium]|nr:hypothetical protein [Bdellovibrionales bacterium]